MATYTVRTAELADLPALAALCRQGLSYDTLAEAELRKLLWHDPDFAPPLSLVAEAQEEPAGAAFGVVRQDPQRGPIGYIKLVVVHPRHQRQGIGRQLVRQLEHELQQRGASEVRVSGSAPRYVWAGVDVRYTPAFCFFRDLGYQRYSDAVNMVVDLATAPLDTAAEEAELEGHGIQVRRLQAADREAFAAWMARWGSNWQYEALAAYEEEPVSCHVALKDGQFVGFAAYDTNRRGWFGPMGTDPEVRRHGIGRTLLKRCLQDQRDLGHRFAEISWTGPIHFYAKAVGARMERIFWLLRKSLA